MTKHATQKHHQEHRQGGLPEATALLLHFYPRDATLARYLRQRRVRPSVRTSVRHTPVLCLGE